MFLASCLCLFGANLQMSHKKSPRLLGADEEVSNQISKHFLCTMCPLLQRMRTAGTSLENVVEQ